MNSKIHSSTKEIESLKESEEKLKSEVSNQNQIVNSFNSKLEELKQSNEALLHEKQAFEANYNQLKQVIVLT